MTITLAHLSPLVALLAGILILIMPRLLNFIIAIYLTFVGDKAMSTVISILITFLVVILVLYLVDRLPIDGRAKYIIRIIVIIIGILSLLRAITAFPI